MPIQILPANPAWHSQFTEIKRLLEAVLPDGAVVHHIGSTAVAGLVAKDIIDVQITLRSLADLNNEAMLSAGFARRKPTSDHKPPGMTLPPEELAKKLYGQEKPIVANIHVREAGRFNQRYPLLCRDYLRAHPTAAAAYGTIKHALANRFPDDVEAYYDIKDPVFDLIMSSAEDWARTTDWRLPTGD